MWQISYPPANGASQGNYFLPKSPFCFASPEIIEVKVCHTQTDNGQTNSLTPYTGVLGVDLDNCYNVTLAYKGVN